jgi:hypothetical protein
MTKQYKLQCKKFFLIKVYLNSHNKEYKQCKGNTAVQNIVWDISDQHVNWKRVKKRAEKYIIRVSQYLTLLTE